jgi:hypothetical protein
MDEFKTAREAKKGFRKLKVCEIPFLEQMKADYGIE